MAPFSRSIVDLPSQKNNSRALSVSVKQKDVDVNLSDLEFVVPSVIYSNAEQVKQAVYKRYIGTQLWQSDFDFGKALVSIASDQNFIAPAVQEARLYAQKNLSVYTYIFDHRNEELEKKQLGYGLEDGTTESDYLLRVFDQSGSWYLKMQALQF
jgi:hypothetical protein